MKRVKHFGSGNGAELENKINNWINVNGLRVNIIDIKYQVSKVTGAEYHDALVIYEE